MLLVVAAIAFVVWVLVKLMLRRLDGGGGSRPRALGPDDVSGGRALATAEAPELELPDVDGTTFALSSLRGQKVLLAAWASW